MEPLASSFGVVLLAELGDKSMLVSLAAATRYRWWMVLTPLAISASLIMGLAVAIGGAASELLPASLVAGVAGALFILFGLLTLQSGDDDANVSAPGGDARSTLGIMAGLGVLFFFAEFGDKSQVATLSLAGIYGSGAAVFVWLGATAGMLTSNSLAVFVGSRLHRVVRPHLLRRIAGAVFIAVGVLTIAVTEW